MFQPLFKGEKLPRERVGEQDWPQRDPGNSTFSLFLTLFLTISSFSAHFSTVSLIGSGNKLVKGMTMVAHSYNPSSGEAEAGGLLSIEGQLGLPSKRQASMS